VLVTRIAPTPSGFLHMGNAVNFVLTWWLARTHHGTLLLRIDDQDVARSRQPYLEDIFRTLEWLGIDVDEGPSGPQELGHHWTMSQHIETMRVARDHLRAAAHPEVFVCRCSRHDLDSERRCAAGCRDRSLPLEPGRTALRWSVGVGEIRGLILPAGDHVLWRRDDLPSYQLSSVVADEHLAVTAIVRGVDLRESSALQLHLAQLLPAPGFARAQILHHGLLHGRDGEKLSKSAGAQAHPMERGPALRERVIAAAEALGAPLGITPP
jgi:glutamyl-tRNA synthetase